MKAHFLLSSVLLLSVAVVTPAVADDSPLKGFGGGVTYSNTIGKGTFTLGEYNDRPSWTMALSMNASYKLPTTTKLSLKLGAGLNKTIIENADSTNTRKNQTYLNDVTLTMSWSDIVNLKDGMFRVSGYGRLYFPTSLYSQLSEKYLGIKAYLGSSYKPVAWFKRSYGFGATKNFNKYDSVVLDTDDFDFPLPSREGGADAIADGLVATGAGITEWTLSNSLTGYFYFLEDFTFVMSFGYSQFFKYKDIPIDEFSSKYAVGGRGYTDSMVGTLELNYDINNYLSLAFGTSTAQLPKTADNKSFRFPWWDTTNGAGNYQTFYFDVAGSF